MKLNVQMYFECEKCGAGVRDWLPVSLHYSDGCYTVLALNKEPPKCACEATEPYVPPTLSAETIAKGKEIVQRLVERTAPASGTEHLCQFYYGSEGGYCYAHLPCWSHGDYSSSESPKESK